MARRVATTRDNLAAAHEQLDEITAQAAAVRGAIPPTLAQVRESAAARVVEALDARDAAISEARAAGLDVT